MAKEIKHYLQWVGGSYYTIESFIDEAKEIGIMRRIPWIPEFNPLKTKVYLVHDVTEKVPGAIETMEHKKSLSELKRYRALRVRARIHPVIFGYFNPVGIVIFAEDKEEVVEAIELKYNTSHGSLVDLYIERGLIARIPIVIVDELESLDEFRRWCGVPRVVKIGRKGIGGVYLSSFKAFSKALSVARGIEISEAMEKLKAELNISEYPPDIVEFKKWVRINATRIRGLKEISSELASRIESLSI